MNKQTYLLLGLCIVFNIYTHNEISTLPNLKKVYLSNFDSVCEAIHVDNNKSFNDHLKNCLKQQKNIKDITKSRMIFDILAQVKENKDLNSEILDLATWDDLSLFRTNKGQKNYVAQHVDKTYTQLGKIGLLNILANPTDDIDELLKRQFILKKIIDNNPLYNFLDNSFLELKKSENLFLSFYSNDPFKNYVNDKYFNSESLSGNHLALNTKNILDIQKKIVIAGAKVSAAVILPIYGLAKLLNKNGNRNFNNFAQTLVSSGDLILGMLSNINNNQIKGFVSLLAGIGCALSCKSEYDQINEAVTLFSCLQERLIAFGEHLRLMEVLGTNLKKHPELYNFLGVDKIDKLFKKDGKVYELIKLMQDKVFKEISSSVITKLGKILLAFKMIDELKFEFSEALNCLSKIEAYFSITKLYKESQVADNIYTFANYTKAEHPILIVDGLWNPIMGNSNVKNALEIKDIELKNIILTGPNEGGKSTIIKSLAISLILAQTFSIAPVKYINIIPFSSIGTYVHVIDDIAAGNSLYKAQINRVYQLVNKLNELPKNKFNFVAFDEPFNGTNFNVAQAISYSLAKNIGAYKNNICIISTHFPLLTELEKNTSYYSNYKVDSYIDNEGNLINNYLLKKGCSEQNFAIKILAKRGFNSSILNDAEAILRSKN